MGYTPIFKMEIAIAITSIEKNRNRVINRRCESTIKQKNSLFFVKSECEDLVTCLLIIDVYIMRG